MDPAGTFHDGERPELDDGRSRDGSRLRRGGERLQRTLLLMCYGTIDFGRLCSGKACSAEGGWVGQSQLNACCSFNEMGRLASVPSRRPDPIRQKPLEDDLARIHAAFGQRMLLSRKRGHYPFRTCHLTFG